MYVRARSGLIKHRLSSHSYVMILSDLLTELYIAHQDNSPCTRSPEQSNLIGRPPTALLGWRHIVCRQPKTRYRSMLPSLTRSSNFVCVADPSACFPNLLRESFRSVLSVYSYTNWYEIRPWCGKYETSEIHGAGVLVSYPQGQRRSQMLLSSQNPNPIHPATYTPTFSVLALVNTPFWPNDAHHGTHFIDNRLFPQSLSFLVHSPVRSQISVSPRVLVNTIYCLMRSSISRWLECKVISFLLYRGPGAR